MKFTLSDRTQIISTLGFVQIFAWGSTYYLLAVLTDPIVKDTGWPRMAVTGGLSVGLLAAGTIAALVGRLIQHRGGRSVMAAATVLTTLGLALLSAACSLPVYFLAWGIIGVGMGAGLYDAAFSTLGRIYGADARRAIASLTLWGGFSATITWPITAWLESSLGWRGTCLAYAGLQLLVLLPLCLAFLPRQTRPPPTMHGHGEPSMPGLMRDLRFWLLAVAGTVLSFIFTAWSVLLFSILQATGVPASEAIALGVLIGPAQVGARVLEMVFGSRYHPLWTMLTSTLLITTGFLGLLLHMPAAAALIAYGAGNGIWSIARGAIPLATFGAQDYPVIMGKLATPYSLVAAAAPFVGSIVLEAFGGHMALFALVCASIIPVVCALSLLTLNGQPKPPTKSQGSLQRNEGS